MKYEKLIGKATYCERNYAHSCADCSMANYGRDCHNNKIGDGGDSLDRCRAEDTDRNAAGYSADKYGNKYINNADVKAFFGE